MFENTAKTRGPCRSYFAGNVERFKRTWNVVIFCQCPWCRPYWIFPKDCIEQSRNILCVFSSIMVKNHHSRVSNVGLTVYSIRHNIQQNVQKVRRPTVRNLLCCHILWKSGVKWFKGYLTWSLLDMAVAFCQNVTYDTTILLIKATCDDASFRSTNNGYNQLVQRFNALFEVWDSEHHQTNFLQF